MNRTLSKEKLLHSGSLILVNARYPYAGVRENEALSPVGDGSSILLNREAAGMLCRLMALLNGWESIAPVSGWRSVNEQRKIWNGSMEENGPDFTRKFVAAPGHSEHQTGLAIDLGLRQENIDFICPAFPYSGICMSFRERAAEFGFVERYPSGRENVTGISHEPWHFRYVGRPHAELMNKMDLTLEEYTDFLRQFPFGDNPLKYGSGGFHWEISFIPWDRELPERALTYPYSISGNNVDGYILTTQTRGEK